MTTSLYERIRTDLARQILSGEVLPGDRIPIEYALMQHYGCSRMTVNKALSALVAAGLINRRKGAGSFVARPRVHSMILDVPDLRSEVTQRGQSYAYRLLYKEIRLPAAGHSHEQELAGIGKLLEIRGLHLADQAPLAVERRLVSLAAAGGIAEVDLSGTSPGTWLLRNIPWTEAETRIGAIGADAESAVALQVEPGTPCLSLERRTWRGNDPITSVRQLFLGSSYDLLARFSHADAAARALRISED